MKYGPNLTAPVRCIMVAPVQSQSTIGDSYPITTTTRYHHSYTVKYLFLFCLFSLFIYLRNYGLISSAVTVPQRHHGVGLQVRVCNPRVALRHREGFADEDRLVPADPVGHCLPGTQPCPR